MIETRSAIKKEIAKRVQTILGNSYHVIEDGEWDINVTMDGSDNSATFLLEGEINDILDGRSTLEQCVSYIAETCSENPGPFGSETDSEVLSGGRKKKGKK